MDDECENDVTTSDVTPGDLDCIVFSFRDPDKNQKPESLSRRKDAKLWDGKTDNEAERDKTNLTGVHICT